MLKNRMLAFIFETTCVGCTLCIRACPEDAIVGARKSPHRVIVDKCTGCEACVPVCPIPDCLVMQAEGVTLSHSEKPIVVTALPVLIADDKSARLLAAKERAKCRRL